MNKQWGLVQQGEHLPIFIEDAVGNTFGHGVEQLTDGLAVYDLFARLVPGLAESDTEDALAKITRILNAGSSEDATAYENAAQSLGAMLNIGDSPVAEDQREALHQRLIQSRATADALGNGDGRFLVDLSAFESADPIYSNALVSLAYRYALVHGNPFVIEGDDSLYAAHNQNGELDLYDDDTGKGQRRRQLDHGRLVGVGRQFRHLVTISFGADHDRQRVRAATRHLKGAVRIADLLPVALPYGRNWNRRMGSAVCLSTTFARRRTAWATGISRTIPSLGALTLAKSWRSPRMLV